MKTTSSCSLSRRSGLRAPVWATASLAALLVAGTPAFAQHGGGGHGGGGGGGGGGHAFMGGGGGGGHGGGFSGGGRASGFGGGHVGGFAGGHVSGFSGGRPSGFAGGGFAGGGRPSGFNGRSGVYSGGPASFNGARAAGFAGGHAAISSNLSAGGARYAPRVGYQQGRVTTSYAGRTAYVGGRPGYGYGYGWGRGGWGWHRPYWGGGYWHGGYWPRAYYGWSYPWFLGVLPGVYATYWWGGIPYYYTNNVYYTWNAGYNGYVVTDPPPVDGDESASSDGEYANAEPGTYNNGGSAGSDIYAYPKSGQSDEQQATDRYECHKWAVAQSGFDPTHASNASGNATDYRRAMTACLDGRGYSAK